MNPNDVITLARSLMTRHGVGYLQFGFHSYPESMGIVGRAHRILIDSSEADHVCNGDCLVFGCNGSVWSKITLSSDWCRFLPESKIRNTILHEIAHTKTPTSSLENPHGPHWQLECHKLGIVADPKFRWDGPVPWEKDYLDPRNPNVKVSDKGMILCQCDVG